MRERRTGPSAEAVGGLARFVEPMPDSPTAPEAVVEMLDAWGSPATVAMAGPRFFGFVIGGSLPAALHSPKNPTGRSPPPAPRTTVAQKIA